MISGIVYDIEKCIYKKGLDTVSYTHLDVYKRQVEHLIQQVLQRDVRLVLNTEQRDQKTQRNKHLILV